MSPGKDETARAVWQTPTNKTNIMNNTVITEILLNFAMAHDWGREAIITGGAIGIYDESEQTVVYFDNMTDLRAWAGY